MPVPSGIGGVDPSGSGSSETASFGPVAAGSGASSDTEFVFAAIGLPSAFPSGTAKAPAGRGAENFKSTAHFSPKASSSPPVVTRPLIWVSVT